MNKTESSAQEFHWEGLEPVPPSYAYSGMILTVVFFQILNKIVTGAGAPKSVQTDFWKWKNLYISWIHAVIVGLWDISCIVWYPEMFQDLVAYHNMHIYGMVCFSTGYFFYDFVDIVLNNMAGKMWEVLLHHVAVAGMFFYNLVECRCLAYNVVALTVEINSAFLHARKLLQMNQVSYSSVFYRIIVWCNLITGFVLRFGAIIAILIGMYIWGHRVSTVYLVLLSASIIIMTVINAVLLTRLLKSDVLRQDSYKKSKKKEALQTTTIVNGNSCSNGVCSNGTSNGHIINNNKQD